MANIIITDLSPLLLVPRLFENEPLIKISASPVSVTELRRLVKNPGKHNIVWVIKQDRNVRLLSWLLDYPIISAKKHFSSDPGDVIVTLHIDAELSDEDLNSQEQVEILARQGKIKFFTAVVETSGMKY